MEGSDHDQESNQEAANFLVLASQSETQYSEWDQQHMLQALPALAKKDNGKAALFPKSDDKKQVSTKKGALLVEDTTDEAERIDNSFSDESDTEGDVTVVKKTTTCTSNDDMSDSPIIKSQHDEDSALRRPGQHVKNIFPSTLSQDDQLAHEPMGDDHITATPSETIGSLRLSGQPMLVPETVEESLDVLAPSPGAYGDVPVIIPSSPTASEGGDPADTSTYNPDANRTFEADELPQRRTRRDRRAKVDPPPVLDNQPITIEDSVPEPGEGSLSVLNPAMQTLACEAPAESLHLMYSATETGDSRSHSDPKTEHGHVGDKDDDGVIEDSQDLALHLTQSQTDARHPQAVTLQRRSKSPSPRAGCQPRTKPAPTKSQSTSDSNGFHLTLPKDGSLIHPCRDVEASKTQEKTHTGIPPAIVQSVPSMSISHMDSQSQSTSDTTFTIEKPDLQMTEEGEEGGSEMTIFQKTRAGKKRQTPARLNISDDHDDSEDFFGINRPKRKQKPDIDELSSQEHELDEDAETQEHEDLAGDKNVAPVVAVGEVDPFEDSTQSYEVPKHIPAASASPQTHDSPSRSLRGHAQRSQRDSSKSSQSPTSKQSQSSTSKQSQSAKSQSSTSKQSQSPTSKQSQSAKSQSNKSQDKHSRQQQEEKERTEEEVCEEDTQDAGDKISEVNPGPIASTSRTDSVLTCPKPVVPDAQECKEDPVNVGSRKTKAQTRTRPRDVDSTSVSPIKEQQNISLPKDSGIGEQLDITSKSETSPKQSEPQSSFVRVPSDPYTFHGTQSQNLEAADMMPKPMTTPLSSRKKIRTAMKRTSTNKDSSSSDTAVKEPVTKPRPKKLKFTKIQRTSTKTINTSKAATSADLPPACPGASSGNKEADTSVRDSDVQTHNTAHKQTEQSADDKTIPVEGTIPLSDSQNSDLLTKTVHVTVLRKVVQCTVTVVTLTNKDGKVVDKQRDEDLEETPYSTVSTSERTTELPLVSPSRTASSLTPGDLADISSGFSRSTGSKSSGSLGLLSPTLSRKDESFTALLTSSSILPSQTPSITTSVLSPQIQTASRPSLALNVGRRETVTPVSDLEALKTPNESVIEKNDSRADTVVTSSGGHRVSDPLFTSPEKGDNQCSDKSEQTAVKSGVQTSPVLKKRAADSSGDSTSDIPSAQRPRISESGGFSVHGSAYSQPRPRLDSPLHILQSSTSGSDIPPSQNRRATRGVEKKTEKSSTDDSHLSPEIPLQTTTTTQVSEATDLQCPVAHASSLEIGSMVMAKWKDGFFYPGKIQKMDQTGSGKFLIRFDDGDQLSVKVVNILLVQHLPVGQSVMVMSPDGYFDCGMVVGYVQEKNKVMYKVSRDEGGTQKYKRGEIILSEDQASCLMSDEEMRVPAAIATLPLNKLGDVSLDNLVVGERRSRHRSGNKDPDKKAENEQSPQKTRSARKGRGQPEQKDEEKSASSRGKKRKLTEGPMATSTPTPKAKKTAVPSAAVTPSTSDIGGAVDSPSDTKRHGRKARVGLFDKSKDSSGASPQLFAGVVFMLTHVEKSEAQKLQERKLLQDSSLETSTEESGVEEEPSVPFDKEGLKANIEAAGGIVLDKYNQQQIDAAKKVYLISSTFHRTVKYFECLAAGIPCVSHQWIIHSYSQGKLLDHKAYMLPAGISLERKKLMEWNACGSCLSGMVVMVVSTNVKFQDAWQSILTISRCKLVNRFPARNKTEDPVEVIVTDGSCPPSILHQAHKLSVPIVTTEWVIQCLINGHTMGFDSHPEYVLPHK